MGARFYTYIWTMYDCMAGGAAAGKRFVVLDRPNPIGRRGRRPGAATPRTPPASAKAIAQQHGMTVGELALLFDGEFLAGRDGQAADVVKMRGWRRGTFYAETGLPWVMPSPNMPTPDTALVYPGTGHVRGRPTSPRAAARPGRSRSSARRTSTGAGPTR